MTNIDNEVDFEEENEVADEAITASTTEQVNTPRKRGRPKGTVVGPRAVVWVCAGIVNGECVQERFSASSEDIDQLDKFSSDDASEAFLDMYDVEPISVLGPFFDKKGTKNITVKKRDTVSIALPKLTSKREKAIYKGWQGIAYDIEGRDDVKYFMFGNEINPNSDKKKNPPTAKTVFSNALKFIEISA
jgi:hypothetical protein